MQASCCPWMARSERGVGSLPCRPDPQPALRPAKDQRWLVKVSRSKRDDEPWFFCRRNRGSSCVRCICHREEARQARRAFAECAGTRRTRSGRCRSESGGKYKTNIAEEIDACQSRTASTCRATSRTKTKTPWSQKRRAFELLRRSERMLRA